MKIAIIGYGYWGPKLVRNFSKLPDCQVAYILDECQNRLSLAKKNWPAIKLTNHYLDILEDDSIDAVAIATPVSSHYYLANLALEHGKHVLLEKPMTTSLIEAQALIQKANLNGKILMVDHTYLYTGAVQAIKKVIDQDQLGDLLYIDSTRINLGLIQEDINVLWDLAPHDISICNYLLNERPIAIQATGASHLPNQLENIAFLTMYYSNNRIAHFNCSWISPIKTRQMIIGGDKKMLVFNDLEPDDKIKIYDKGFDLHAGQDQLEVNYRSGDVELLALPKVEALTRLAMDFLKAIKTGEEPLSNASSGLEVVRILEAANKSLQNKGELMELPEFINEV